MNDIVKEILDADRLLPEGVYEGAILTCEFDLTMNKRTPYARFTVVIKDKKVHCFTALNIGNMAIFKLALPKLVGERVRLDIKHREYNEQSYMDAMILGGIDG
jgi:hypothetical protein